LSAPPQLLVGEVLAYWMDGLNISLIELFGGGYFVVSG
jgi:gentisate 1,2-dioxygenase